MKPYEIFGQHLIEENAIEQMDKVMSIPPARYGALMPDAHHGYGMPIGGVAVLQDAVSPGFVGYDIACRMKLTIFDDMYSAVDVTEDWMYALQDSTRLGVGCHFDDADRRDHPIMEDPRITELGYDKDRMHSQLGTSGAGNHFLDVVKGELYLEAGTCEDPYASKEFIGLLTHSGSRGPGHWTATKYIKLARAYVKELGVDIPKGGYEWLSTETDQGREYLMAMELMGDYAQANHNLIHQNFMAQLNLTAWRTYDNHHNYAWKVPGTTNYTHRKGATPAGEGVVGVIPGTSGSNSYLVRGLGNKASLHSAPHGAGRPFSRKEAKRQHDGENFRSHMAAEGIKYSGLAGDETVFAYKDIEAVIAASSELCKVIGMMKPLMVLMAGGG